MKHFTKEEVGVVVKMYLEGATYKEIAEHLEVSAQNIGQVLKTLRYYGADIPKRWDSTGIAVSVRQFLKK